MVKILIEKGEKVQSMQREKGKGLVNAERKGKGLSQRREKRERVESTRIEK